MNYKFIVISASKERKEVMTELFKQLNVSDKLIYYLEASTLQNTENYFVDSLIAENDKKIICCAKSHFRAIEYATMDESPNYSIILEDDCAFHKTHFMEVIEQIILNWSTHFNDCDYVSLGWIPIQNYTFYTTKPKMVIESISNIDNNIYFLNDFYNIGLQCYIVNKNKISQISSLLNQKTYNIYVDKLNNYITTQFKQDDVLGISLNVVDYLLNRLLNNYIIFPPLAIEQKNTKSLLEHNNFDNYIRTYFNGHEDKMTQYMTF